MLRYIFVSHLACLGFIQPVGAADCLDRTLAISRYHYVNPGSIADNWQDIYEISLVSGAVQTTTRLTKGAVSIPWYDSSAFAYSLDGAKIAFIESDAGGTNPRLKVMDAVDTNGDLEGDNVSILDASDVDITSVAWGPGNTLVYGKLDANQDTQIVSATLTGTTLGAISFHTSDTDYPDAFSFAANNQLIYGADGNSIKHIDFGTNAITALTGPSPRDRLPTARMIGADLFFARIVGNTLDVWKATLNAGPTLSGTKSFLTTPTYNEVSLAISGDGACLAYLAGDLATSYGPNSDLWIRDLTTGQTQQITQTRDLSSVAWKP